MFCGSGLNRPLGVDVQNMEHDEIAWRDVLFEGFEVLVTAAVHGVSGLMVRLSGRSGESRCPSCGRSSARVHDRYERGLQDLPLAGHAVGILLSVWRFVCAEPTCSQRTFAEQIPGLTNPYARCTTFYWEDLLGTFARTTVFAAGWYRGLSPCWGARS